MAPGESRFMKFTVRSHVHGIENEVSHLDLVQNGTFFNNFIAPQIGYQPAGELSDKNDRKKYGLKEKDLMPALERNCDEHCRNTYLSNNSDWVNVDTVISTTPDQIAVASRLARKRVDRKWSPLLPLQARSLLPELLFLHFSPL